MFTRDIRQHSNHVMAVTIIMLDVFLDDKKVGEGYVLQSYMYASSLMVADMEGKELPDAEYDYKVKEHYHTTVNGRRH